MKKIEKKFSQTAKLAILTLAFCFTFVGTAPSVLKVAAAETSAKFEPAPGKTLLFIGQDKNEMDAYAAVQDMPTPAAFMMYTNIATLEGMEAPFDGAGGGLMDFQHWSNTYGNTSMVIGVWASTPALLDDTASGKYDNNIKKMANLVKATNKPVFIRFGYEFDGPWDPVNNYAPEKYVPAYKHFVDVMREAGASNVSFVWHSAAFFRLGETNIWPNADGSYDQAAVDQYLSQNTEKLNDWYPGDNYVDWVGLSWFQWPQAYQENAAEVRRAEVVNFAKAHNKPVMIAEAAPKEIYQPKDQATNNCWNNWYLRVFNYIEANDIKAYCYINQDWNAQPMWRSQGGWGDTRVQTNQVVLNNWINKISEPRYLNGSNSLYAAMGYIPDKVWNIPSDTINARDYSNKAYANDQWCITDNDGFIGFNGQWTWADYTVKVTEPGYYTLSYNYASGMTPTTRVFVNGVAQDSDVTLPFTGSNWVTFGEAQGQTVSFPYPGNYIVRIQAPQGGINLKWIKFSLDDAPAVPGRIEAEAYTANANMANHETFAGFNAANAWAEYKINVKSEGDYLVKYSIASQMPDGTPNNPTLQLLVDNHDEGTVSMNKTGDWTNFTERDGQIIHLSAGKHTLRIVSPTAWLNLDYISFIQLSSVPGKIEAEAYASKAASGVQTNGSNVGFSEDNSWIDYKVNLASSGRYTVDYNAASDGYTGRITLVLADDMSKVATGEANLATTNLINTFGWGNFGTVKGGSFNLTQGLHTIRVFVNKCGFNLDWLRITPAADYTAAEVTSTIQAESFKSTSGTALTSTNAGTEAAVGFIDTGDTLDYDINVAQPGKYKLEYAVATGATASVELKDLSQAADSVLVTFNVPNTGGWGWDNYQTKESSTFHLAAGKHSIRLHVPTGNAFNLDWIKFTMVTPDPSIVTKPTVNGVSVVEVTNALEVGKDNVIEAPVDNSASTVKIVLKDIAAVKTGEGSVTIRMNNNSTIMLPFNTIAPDLLVDGAQVELTLQKSADSTLVEKFKAVKKEFRFVLAVVSGGESASILNPGGNVQIKLGFTDADLNGLDKSKLAVFYYDETTKNYELMPTTVDGNNITFKASYSGRFIAAEKSAASAPSPLDSSSGTPLPRTGSPVDLYSLLLLGAVIIGLGYASFRKGLRKS